MSTIKRVKKLTSKKVVQTNKSVEDTLKLLELCPSFQVRVRAIRETLKIQLSSHLDTRTYTEKEKEKFLNWFHREREVFGKSADCIQQKIEIRQAFKEDRITLEQKEAALAGLENGYPLEYLPSISQSLAKEYGLSPKYGPAIEDYIASGSFRTQVVNYHIQVRTSPYGGRDVSILLFGNLSTREKKQAFLEAEAYFARVHPDLTSRYSPHHKIDRDIQLYKVRRDRRNLKLKNNKEIVDHVWREDAYGDDMNQSKRRQKALKAKQSTQMRRKENVAKQAISRLSKEINKRFPKEKVTLE